MAQAKLGPLEAGAASRLRSYLTARPVRLDIVGAHGVIRDQDGRALDFIDLDLSRVAGRDRRPSGAE